uniref:Uncharacterized protein n=1 Tax=Talaromyces marneffei PM1 TaxID=1077442 RepID=A0A093V6J4_TALMA
MPLIRQEHYSFHIVIIGYSRVAVAPVPGNLIHGLYEALGVNFVYRRTTRMENIRFDESLSFTPIDQLLRQNGIKAISQLIETEGDGSTNACALTTTLDVAITFVDHRTRQNFVITIKERKKHHAVEMAVTAYPPAAACRYLPRADAVCARPVAASLGAKNQIKSS